MPTQIKIIRASEFIIATPQGQVDLEKSKQLLVKIALASATLSAHEILLDIRKSGQELSAIDLWQLAAELSDRRTVFAGKIAILCQLNHSNLADFFALCAQNRGFPVKAFTSYEQAVEWLIEGNPQLLEEIV